MGAAGVAGLVVGDGMTLRAIDVGHLPQVVPADQAVPVLQWVNVADLRVDETYQRPLEQRNWQAIQRIAARFSWQRFGAVLVAPMAGGQFSIVDGQHRAHAAALCGFQQVPAMIVLMTPQEQAGAFVGVNAAVVRPSAHQIYKAALAAGETWAVALDAAVVAAGCRMMTYHPSGRHRQAGCLYAPVWPAKVLAQGHGAALTAGLLALRTFDSAGRVALWTDYIVQPWVRGVVLAAERLRHVPGQAVLGAVLGARDPFRVVDAAGRDGGPVMKRAAERFAAMIFAEAQQELAARRGVA